MRRQRCASPPPAPLRAVISPRRRPGGARCRPVSTFQAHPTIYPDYTPPRAPAWLWPCRRSDLGLPSFQPSPFVSLTSGARGLDAGRGLLPAGPTVSTHQGGQEISLSLTCDFVIFQFNSDCSLATRGPTGEVFAQQGRSPIDISRATGALTEGNRQRPDFSRQNAMTTKSRGLTGRSSVMSGSSSAHRQRHRLRASGRRIVRESGRLCEARGCWGLPAAHAVAIMRLWIPLCGVCGWPPRTSGGRWAATVGPLRARVVTAGTPL